MKQAQVGVDIVERIADRQGVDPLDLDVPLYEVVDADALEALTNGTMDSRSGANLRVEFTYYGYAVTVNGDGTVAIDEGSPGTDEASRTESARD